MENHYTYKLGLLASKYQQLQAELDKSLPANVKHKLANGKTALSYFIGDCSALDTFLDKRKGIIWVIPKYLNALFRGVGQVIFCNNPWSGFLILFSLYWADITVGIATTLAASTAILTAFIFVQDESRINAGLTTYNAVLVGSVTSSLWTPQYGEPVTLKLYGFIILAAALSVLINTGLGNILGSFKPTLPSFTLAFNTITILLFTTLQPRPSTPAGKSEESSESFLLFPHKDENLHVVGVVQGILLSMGQVYAINNLVGSIIMYLSALLYSPIVFVMSVVGATVGSCFGIVFAEPSYDSVYNGIWGFNQILACIAVGAFFYIPGPVSFLLALADVALVVFVQQAFTIAFTPLKLPFLTFPFVLSSIIMLSVTATMDKLHRVGKFSFPEMHIYEYILSLGEMASNSTSMPSSRRKEKSEDDWFPSPSAPLLPIHENLEEIIHAHPNNSIDNAGYHINSDPQVKQRTSLNRNEDLKLYPTLESSKNTSDYPEKQFEHQRVDSYNQNYHAYPKFGRNLYPMHYNANSSPT